jgi:hypothetical protein
MRNIRFIVELMCFFGLVTGPAMARGEEQLNTKNATFNINQIMVAAHVRDIDGKGNRGSKRNLDTRVLSGKATEVEKQRLLELYRLLAREIPPRGSLGKWKRFTSPLVVAMEGVVANRADAAEQLEKALDCKTCHEQFRVGFHPGLSNLTDLDYYKTLQESGQFTDASGLSLPPRDLVALAGKIKGAGGRQIIEKAGGRPRGWTLLVDFPEKTSDDALRLFDSLKGLSEIRILDGGVTDRGLGYLRNLPDLRVLVVNSREITDDGMKPIAALKSLRNLEIVRARISGKGLTSLAELKELKELSLRDAEVSDDAVAPLMAMRQIEWLYLPSSVSASKLQELQLALPKTHVLQDASR